MYHEVWSFDLLKRSSGSGVKKGFDLWRTRWEANASQGAVAEIQGRNDYRWINILEVGMERGDIWGKWRRGPIDRWGTWWSSCGFSDEKASEMVSAGGWIGCGLMWRRNGFEKRGGGFSEEFYFIRLIPSSL